jgi:hypothetical protein
LIGERRSETTPPSHAERIEIYLLITPVLVSPETRLSLGVDREGNTALYPL